MKTIANFEEVKRTEKAILIKANIEELNQEVSFWLPLSKVTIEDSTIQIEDDVWTKKLEELKQPKEEEKVGIISKAYEKGDKATKLVVDVKVKDKEETSELWVFIANSQIENIEKIQDDKIKVILPLWIWKSAFSNSCKYQLDNFYNKGKEDGDLMTEDDFKLVSDSETV